jgi:hypothetical protein
MNRALLLTICLLLLGTSLLASDPAIITLDKSKYTVHEGDGTGSFTIVRTGDEFATCSLQYRISNFTPAFQGGVVFAAHELSKTITFPIEDDHAYDNRELFIILENSSNAFLSTPSVSRLNIIDNDPEPVATIASATVAEGDVGVTAAHMAVKLSAPFKVQAEVFVSVVGGNATVDSDYERTVPSGDAFSFVQFAPGQTAGDAVFRVIGDRLSEPDETIVVQGSYLISPNVNAETLLATLTILNDDYFVTPDSQQIARGTIGTVNVTTSVPTPATDHVLLSSSNPSVASVPPFIDIAAGSLGKSFDVTANSIGSAVITVTMPASRGGVVTTLQVDVYAPTFYSFEKPALSAALGQTATATLHFDPPPSEPVILFLSQTNPSIASIPAIFTVGTNGVGTFTLRGTGVGSTVITTAIPPSYGGATTGFRFDVTAPTGFVIGRIDSTSGPATGGRLVTIFGEGMSNRCTAMFDGVSGLNTSASASGSLTTNTPPHDPGQVDVSVRCGADTGTLPKAYTYLPALSRIINLSPTTGSPGSLIAVTGENLRRGRCSLSFGGVAATTMQNDSTTAMLVAAPPHAPGSADVSMRCGSEVSTLSGAFLYTGNETLPQIIGITPTSGAPGERVLVAGSGFRDDDALLFDSVAGLDVTSTNEQHFVTVPDLPPGNVTISLHDIAGHITMGPGFRVLSAVTPQITSAPAHVFTSSEFPITGAGFKRSLNFLLGGTLLQQVTIASTFGKLRLPDSIGPGTYSLTITNQNVAPRTIQVTDGVSVSSVSSPCASTEGGLMVTIKGNGFATGAVVAFGASDSADVTVRDAHTIVALVPPSSGIANETITVTNPTGESEQLSNAFRYRWPDPGCGTTRHRGASH